MSYGTKYQSDFYNYFGTLVSVRLPNGIMYVI